MKRLIAIRAAEPRRDDLARPGLTSTGAHQVERLANQLREHAPELFEASASAYYLCSDFHSAVETVDRLMSCGLASYVGRSPLIGLRPESDLTARLGVSAAIRERMKDPRHGSLIIIGHMPWIQGFMQWCDRTFHDVNVAAVFRPTGREWISFGYAEAAVITVTTKEVVHLQIEQ